MPEIVIVLAALFAMPVPPLLDGNADVSADARFAPLGVVRNAPTFVPSVISDGSMVVPRTEDGTKELGIRVSYSARRRCLACRW